MRILKYIFLLILLSFVALSIFIATQKGDFSVERSKIINAPKNSAFNYVNDYRNWPDFGSWATEDPEMKVQFPQNTIGKGASYSWEGNDGNGSMNTLYTKDMDSIVQKMDFNGSISSVYWQFKDTIGGTKVTWKTKGKMSFLFKIYTAMNGGVDQVIGTMYEKSLINLDKALDYEINTFSLKVDGLTKKPQVYYLSQSFTSEIGKVNKNFKIVVSKIKAFCEQNDIQLNGKPFIIYHNYDLVRQLTKISICLPITKEIFISQGSEIVAGKLPAIDAVKTTVTGDISHVKKGFDKAVDFLNKNQLTPDPSISHIEIYTITKSENKNPSKWITEIYVPFIPKAVPVKTYYQAPVNQSIEEKEPVINSTQEPVKINKTIIPKKNTIQKPKEEEPSEF